MHYSLHHSLFCKNSFKILFLWQKKVENISTYFELGQFSIHCLGLVRKINIYYKFINTLDQYIISILN